MLDHEEDFYWYSWIFHTSWWCGYCCRYDPRSRIIILNWFVIFKADDKSFEILKILISAANLTLKYLTRPWWLINRKLQKMSTKYPPCCFINETNFWQRFFSQIFELIKLNEKLDPLCSCFRLKLAFNCHALRCTRWLSVRPKISIQLVEIFNFYGSWFSIWRSPHVTS